MMNMDMNCTFDGNRDEVLISYLYDDLEPAARVSFERHLAVCSTCRCELEEFGVVRQQLEQWSPPQPALRTLPGGRFGLERGKRSWMELPVWAQVAAAALLIGVSASIANLDVTYGANGLSVRTGWIDSPSRTDEPHVAAGSPAVGQTSVPWRADLMALEETL